MHATPRQRAAILLVHESGIRYSDVFRATWGDVDETWCIRFVASKSGRREVRRLTPATAAACAALQATPGPRAKLLPWPYRSRTPWDDGWHTVPGTYAVIAAHALDDPRLSAELTLD